MIYINKVLTIVFLFTTLGCVGKTGKQSNIQSTEVIENNFDVKYFELIADNSFDFSQSDELFELLEANKNSFEKKDYHYIKSELYAVKFKKAESYDELILAYENGHVEAGYQLYIINVNFKGGSGKGKNLEYLKEAALRGSKSAMFLVGSKSITDSNDYFSKEIGLDMLRKTALNGYPQAISRMGGNLIYRNGVINKTEHVFWENVDLLKNKSGEIENIDDVYLDVENKFIFCSLFNEFSKNNFQFITESGLNPNPKRFEFWIKSFIFCNSET